MDRNTSTIAPQFTYLPSRLPIRSIRAKKRPLFSLNNPEPQSMNHFPASSLVRRRFQTILHMTARVGTQSARLLRLGCLALSLVILAPAAECVAQPTLLLDPAFPAPQRPGVPFDHDRHAEDLDCTLCHHSYENSQNIWEPDMQTRCSACHEAGARGRLGLRQAWHGQCVGCHEQSPKAPVTCGECHVRGQERQPR